MSKLPRQKRTRLVGVIVLTLVVLAGLWFSLIRAQQQALTILADRKATASRKVDQMSVAIKDAPRLEAEVAQASQALDQLETGMANGDLYSWIINTIRDFKQPYQVDIPQFSQIDGPRANSLLPQFPYKQATLTIGGTAYFEEFGKFVANMENKFPYMRLVNLNLEPTAADPAEPEKLAFRMEVVALVKPGNS